MKLKLQKRIACSLKKVGKKRIKFNEESLAEIKEAITKKDIQSLIKEKKIKIKKVNATSRVRANKRLKQRRKGRQKGLGTRKGRRTARLPRKRSWILKIRVQRNFLKELKSKDILDAKTYKKLYLRAKSGFFRSRNHLKTYIQEQNLTKNGKK